MKKELIQGMQPGNFVGSSPHGTQGNSGITQPSGLNIHTKSWQPKNQASEHQQPR